MSLKKSEPDAYKRLSEAERENGLEYLRVLAEKRDKPRSTPGAVYLEFSTEHLKQYIYEREARQASRARLAELAVIAGVTWLGAIIGSALTAYFAGQLHG